MHVFRVKPHQILVAFTITLAAAYAQSFKGTTLVSNKPVTHSVAAGDLNKDGKPDIVFTSLQKISWLRNLGGGLFASPVVIDSKYEAPEKILCADMDKDGDLDLVVNIPVRSYETGQAGLHVYKNNGSGVFAPAAVWDLFQNDSHSDFDVADFDGDGAPDIAIVPYSFDNAGARIELNSGSGDRKGLGEQHRRYLIDNRFVPFPDHERHAQFIAVGNFNADNERDVVIGSSTDTLNRVSYGAVDACRNQGAGIFALNQFATLALNSEEHEIVNSDFLRPVDPIIIRSITAANVDKLGADDVIADMQTLNNQGLYWWPNKGTFFSNTTEADARQITPPRRNIYAYKILDYEGDGDGDLAVVLGRDTWGTGDPDYDHSAFEFMLLLNDGTGRFSQHVDGVIDSLGANGGTFEKRAMASADFDGDGNQDIVLVGEFTVNDGQLFRGVRLYLSERSKPPSPYAAWVQSFGLEYEDVAKTADPDFDGNDNQTEFADGTNPTLRTSVHPRLFLRIIGPGTVVVSPSKSKYAYGETVTLTATPTGAIPLFGWYNSSSFSTDIVLKIDMDKTKDILAYFAPTFEGAVDREGFDFSAGGNENWFPQTITTHDGVDAVQSGAIQDSQQSWFETTVTGPGNLSFWWKVSSEGSDTLGFYIDGVLQSGRISGAVNWTQKKYEIPAGSHVLRWRYAKDFSGGAGLDTAWVDQIVWSTFPAAAAAAGLTGDNALPNSMPFNDGVENLLKYAFKMNLSGPDVRTMSAGGNAGLPSIRQVGTGAAGILRFEFVRRIGSGLVYTPKKSTTLTAAGWTDLTDTPTIVPINTNWERVIYKEPSDPAVVPKCFGRVEVEIP